MGVRRGVKTGAKPGGGIEGIALSKTYELTLFTMIVYNSENSIFPQLFFVPLTDAFHLFLMMAYTHKPKRRIKQCFRLLWLFYLQ